MNDTFEVNEIAICIVDPSFTPCELLKYDKEECTILFTDVVYMQDDKEYYGYDCEFADGEILFLKADELKKIIPPSDDVAWAKQKVKDLLNKLPELIEA